MRASIIAWSMASGLAMGILADAALIGAAFLLALVRPELPGRLNQRWLTIGAVAILSAVPIVFTALGYLEGELKAG